MASPCSSSSVVLLACANGVRVLPHALGVPIGHADDIGGGRPFTHVPRQNQGSSLSRNRSNARRRIEKAFFSGWSISANVHGEPEG
jgi:hypothetical protein